MNLRCYVLDDEPHNVRHLAGYIEKTEGLELVGSAYSPLVALEEIRACKPDLVFSDINMPDMSGITLAGLIDGICKVVFISAESQSRYSGIDWKNYMYLNKPISFGTFERAVKEIAKRLSGV